ncbi:hypothetical protein ABTI08_20195, partial [Acinetobacter baumannii]
MHTINSSGERFGRRHPLRIPGCEIDDEADNGLADVVDSADAEAADFDQAGQFRRRPHDQISGACVEV